MRAETQSAMGTCNGRNCGNPFLTEDCFYFLSDLESKIVSTSEQGRKGVEGLRKEKKICRSRF